MIDSVIKELHASLDGWLRMNDRRWHFFCGHISLCGGWVMPAKMFFTFPHHQFPVCITCLKQKFGL